MLFNTFTTLLFSLQLVSGCYIPHTRTSSTSATPTSTASVTIQSTSGSQGMTAAQIKQVAPSTASCTGSNTACRTADQAVTFINQSFEKYGFNTAGEQAALFSLMAFESGNFQYDVNLFPGRPGQGTRNMMMFDFVLPYAIETNPSAVRAIRSDLTAQSTSADVPNDDQKNAIRATVLSDELSFASAAWFLRTKCSPDVAQALQAGTVDGFNTYMGSSCVNAGQDPARLAIYQATLTAMGH